MPPKGIPRPNSRAKPMTQASTQGEFLPVSTGGLFPRYQGKTCDGTSLSGRVIVNLGGTTEVSDFCPKGTIGMGLLGTKVFFVSPVGRAA